VFPAPKLAQRRSTSTRLINADFVADHDFVFDLMCMLSLFFNAPFTPRYESGNVSDKDLRRVPRSCAAGLTNFRR
jgi:hypothetical protein